MVDSIHSRPAFALIASIICSPCAVAGQVLVEAKVLEVTASDFFDNTAHLAGAIDLGGAASVPVQGVRGVWGLQTPGRFTGNAFGTSFIDGTRLGVQWEIGGFRELMAVLKGSDAASFGRSSAGAIPILSKIGSDTVFPATNSAASHVGTPRNLLIRLNQPLVGEVGEYVPSADSQTSLLLVSNYTVSTLAKVGDPVPGHPGTDISALIGHAPLTSNHAAYLAQGLSLSGAYVFDRSTTATHTAIENNFQNGNLYGNLNDVDLKGNKLAVAADNGLLVTDIAPGSPVQVLVPALTEYAPGLRVTGFSEVHIQNGHIAFRAAGYGGLPGAFLAAADGSVTKIVDGLTPIPSGTGNFAAAQQIGISDEMAAFIGFDDQFKQAGLFLFVDGEIIPVARPGDSKDGKTVSRVDFMSNAVDHNVLAYTAYFTDNSSASYLVAVVPEPATWLYLAAGLGLLGLRLRHSTRRTDQPANVV